MGLVRSWAEWSRLVSQTIDAYSAQRALASLPARVRGRVRDVITRTARRAR
jgi:hypothetical protein